MIAYSTDASGFDALARRFRGAGAIVDQELGHAMRDIGPMAVEEVAKRTTSERIKRNLQAEVRANGGRATVYVSAPGLPWVPFVEYNTRPHIIEPRTAKALRWAKGGKVFFAKRVRHPGTTGQAMFSRGRDAAAPKARRRVQLAMRRAADRIVGSARLAA